MKKIKKSYKKGGKVVDFSPVYAEPVQPYILGKEPWKKPKGKAINQLSNSQLSQLPIQNEQYQPTQIPALPHYGPNYIQEPGYGQQRVVNGQVDIPQNKYGGPIQQAMKKTNGKKLKKAAPGTQLEQQTSLPANNNYTDWQQPQIPQDVNDQFQAYQEGALMNDPIALDQAKPNKGLPGVSPDVLASQAMQREQPQITGSTHAGPNFHINTADMRASTLQGINALIPWRQPKDNRNLYTQAIQNHPNGTGSVAAFDNGGVVQAKSGFKLNPEHEGYCTPITKSTCTGKRKVFALNAKAHFKKRKAENGDTIGDIRQQYNDQHYTPTEQWNHDQSMQDNSVVPIQQDIMNLHNGSLGKLGQMAINTPNGVSPVDGWRGNKTGAYSYKPLQYEYQHNGQVQDTYNAGNHYEQGIDQDAQRTANQWGTGDWVANNTGTDIKGTQHNYNKYLQDTPSITPAQTTQGVPHNFTGAFGGKNYIGGVEDTPAAANGMMIPAGNGLQVEDGKFKYLSPDTVELTGKSHDDGGQLIQANGQTVEAEGAETIHVSPVDGSTNVGGNLYIPGTRTKYKQGFKEIAGMERKNEKLKTKVTIVSGNITDPNNNYGSPAAGSVRVMNDALKQKEQMTTQTKQYLTDSQNMQLELADKVGVEPKEVTKWLGGKAKWGMKMKKATDGSVLEQQQRMMKEHPDWVKEALDKYGQPKANRFDDGLNGPRTEYVRNYLDEKSSFNPNPATWAPNSKLPSRNQPGFPDTFPQQINKIEPVPMVQMNTSQLGYTPVEAQVPGNPDYKAPTDKKFVKGARNRFHISDYLGEITTLFDRPEPVQSMQVNPILEPEYNLSLQQKKNSIISAYKPALQGTVKSSGQQAAIAGQMAEQLSAVDSEELALNQQNTGQIRARNIQELHGTRDMNTQLVQQQIQQQAQAKAITDQNRFNAANSVSQKEAQRRAQNNSLSMYEQYAGWAWDPNTHQYYMNHPDYQFGDVSTRGFNPDAETGDKKSKSERYFYDEKGRKIGRRTDEEKYIIGGTIASRNPKAGKGKKMKYC